MEINKAKQLQKQITKEALAIVSIAGKAANVLEHEQTIRLIGAAWKLPSEETDAMLDLIQQEKTVMHRVELGEDIPHVTLDGLDSKYLLLNWSGLEILTAVEDLFETAIQLNSYDDRKTMLNTATALIEQQNFLDWIEKTPAELELLKVATA